MKKFISLLICMLLIFGTLPLSISALNDSPIESISVSYSEPIMEYTNGYYNPDSGNFDYYLDLAKLFISVSFNDGRDAVTLSVDNIDKGQYDNIYADVFDYGVRINGYEFYEENYLLIEGKTVTVELDSLKAQCSVEIISSDVKSVKASMTKAFLIPGIDTETGFNEYYGKTYERYAYEHLLKFTVEHTDGRIVTGDYDTISKLYRSAPYIEDTQGGNMGAWDAGDEKECSVTFLGKECTARLRIKNTTNTYFNSLECTYDGILFQNHSGYYDVEYNNYNNEFFRYIIDENAIYVKVDVKNKGYIEGYLPEILDIFSGEWGWDVTPYIDDNQHYKSIAWTVGENTAYVSILGLSVPMTCYVYPMIISDITFEPYEVSSGFFDYTYDEERDSLYTSDKFIYDLNPEEIYMTVTLIDGSTMELALLEFMYGFSWMEEIYNPQYEEGVKWQVGKTYHVPVTIFDIYTELPVKVLDDGIKSATVDDSGDDLVINVVRDDGFAYGGTVTGYDLYQECFFTDSGEVFCGLNQNENGQVFINIGRETSNAFNHSFLDKVEELGDIAYSVHETNSAGKLPALNYSGILNKENLDSLIWNTFTYLDKTDYGKPTYVYGQTYLELYGLDDFAKAMGKLFSAYIPASVLKASSFYNEEYGKLCLVASTDLFDLESITLDIPAAFHTYKESFGTYYEVTMLDLEYADYVAAYYIMYDKDGKIAYFSDKAPTKAPVAQKLADINGDERINAMDLSIMKSMILGAVPCDEFCLAIADLNKDGKLNAADILLIKQTLIGA